MTLNFTVPLEISLLTERLYLFFLPRDGFARATALLGMAVTLSTCQLRSGSTDDSNVSLCLRGRRIGTTPLLGTEDCFDCFCDESLGFHTGARPQVCSCGWSLRRKLQRIAIARQGWQNDNGNLRQLVHNVVRSSRTGHLAPYPPSGCAANFRPSPTAGSSATQHHDRASLESFYFDDNASVLTSEADAGNANRIFLADTGTRRSATLSSAAAGQHTAENISPSSTYTRVYCNSTHNYLAILEMQLFQAQRMSFGAGNQSQR
ncbi:predicted protein [Plenodomus lingam JN3]|uniref:Predicted protein n=1 Tax=Leptosphaeria maculans (strain JN3 / isolate v23.1.3 / race Av1-4-5-6-7-8) TaxID=985895 RepID=E4ZNM9_LEPMJ|nr:predicted protein [Plenodomus lingam JN3]CBX93248.1 predicted protein [Plenodomus lingam JN3]